MADWYIKFTGVTSEGQEIPHTAVERINALADDIPVVEDSGTPLSQTSLARRREVGWYNLVETVTRDDKLDILGNPLYTISGDNAERTWPDRVPQPREMLQTQMLARLSNEKKRAVEATVVVAARRFFPGDKTIALLNLYSSSNRAHGVPDEDDDLVDMTAAQRADLINAIIAQTDAALDTQETKRAELKGSVTLQDMRDYDLKAGF